MPSRLVFWPVFHNSFNVEASSARRYGLVFTHNIDVPGVFPLDESAMAAVLDAMLELVVTGVVLNSPLLKLNTRRLSASPQT
jgi:hypothetical protein